MQAPLENQAEVSPKLHTPCATGARSRLDQSGRILGPRALKTRARILEATLAMLDEKSMRDLRVIDIARRIGSSPATFYQYFKDAEDVVLELSTYLQDAVPAIVKVIQGDWGGHEGYERGRRLGNLSLERWGPFAAVLRARNTASEEGDEAFRAVRQETLAPILTALGKIIREAHPLPMSNPPEGEWLGGEVHPIAAAFSIVGGLERMAQHHVKFEKRFSVEGEGTQQIVNTFASMVQFVLS